MTSVHPRFDTRIYHKICKSLAAEGYRVRLIVADGNGDQEKDSIFIEDVGKNKLGRFSRIFVTTWMLFIRALRTDAQIVHFHDPELIPQAYLLSLLGRKVIFDMHENVPKQIANKPWLSSFSKKVLTTVYTCLERLTLNKFHVVYAESSYQKDYPWLKNTSVILNLPDVGSIASIPDQGKFVNFTVGYIGGCSAERGVLRVASAIKQIRENNVDMDYLCIGPQTQNVEDNKLFQAGIKEGWIDAPGRMDATAGWPLIKKCSVGMAVLEPIPNYLESWPTKMFEYLAMGLPVIVSDFPMYKDFVENYDCGICVNPYRQDQIAEAIMMFYEKPDVAHQMGLKGQKAVFDKFNWQHEEAKLVALYANLISA